MSKDWASQRPTLWNAIASELVASDLGRLDCAYIYMRQNGNGHKPKSKDDAADDDDNGSDDDEEDDEDGDDEKEGDEDDEDDEDKGGDDEDRENEDEKDDEEDEDEDKSGKSLAIKRCLFSLPPFSVYWSLVLDASAHFNLGPERPS